MTPPTTTTMTAADRTFLIVLGLFFILALIGAQTVASQMTKVVHVDGHTCIETRGMIRSISCDWTHTDAP